MKVGASTYTLVVKMKKLCRLTSHALYDASSLCVLWRV